MNDMPDTMQTPDQPTTAGAEMLDFWADWCGPCKMMNPILDELEKEYAGRLTITKLDVDDEKNHELVQHIYDIRSVPTYVFLKNGEMVDQVFGVQPKDVMVTKIEALLK